MAELSGLVICSHRMDGIIIETRPCGTSKKEEIIDGKKITKDVIKFKTTLIGATACPIESLGEEAARADHYRLLPCF